MKLTGLILTLALVLCAMVPAFAAPKASAEDQLKAIEAIKLPMYNPPKENDQEYMNKFMAERQEALEKRGTLIVQFVVDYPTHEKALPLLEGFLGNGGFGSGETYTKQRSAILAVNPPDAIVSVISFFDVVAVLVQNDDPAKAKAAIDGFVANRPNDPRGAELLFQAAMMTSNTDEKKAYFATVAEKYPESPYASMGKGYLKRMDGVGKPFELTFTCAVSGKKVDISDMKGKVILIDFWATWCGPCRAKMPEMKEIYATYKPKGLEFIGVSLDQPESEGGLDSLKKYVADEKLEWAQYYQGNGWDSEFSSAWGIMSIPALFLVDKNGILRYADDPQDLKATIEKLLAE